MNILILCQRKCSTIDSNVEKTIKIIKNFVEKQNPNITNFNYTFITPGTSNDQNPNCADVFMIFDMFTQQTLNWVKQNQNKYDSVILHTCPSPLFNPSFWFGIAKVLTNKGLLYMTTIKPINPILINLTLKLIDNKYENLAKFNKESIEMINLLFNRTQNELIKKTNVDMTNVYKILITYNCKNKVDGLLKIFPLLPE